MVVSYIEAMNHALHLYAFRNGQASSLLCRLVSSLLGALIRSALHGRPDGWPADMLLIHERGQHLGVCHRQHFQGLLILMNNRNRSAIWRSAYPEENNVPRVSPAPL